MWFQKLAEFSLRIVYLLGFNNLVANALSKQLDEASQPNDAGIGESRSELYALQDPVIYAAIED